MMSFSVKGVVLLNAQQEKIGEAVGMIAVRLMLADFAKHGVGKVLVLSSPGSDEIKLAMSHGGDLQVSS